jgi:hypothetical protein
MMQCRGHSRGTELHRAAATPFRWMRRLVCIVPALVTMASAQNPSAPGTVAFPGAEGFGAQSRGGRGGAVVAVTNLNDAGEGSLRWACSLPGPRTVVFRVSGIIDLDTLLVIREPYLTIAGQTAPGDGICIRAFGVVIESTHDIVVRHLRVRPGDGARVEQDAIWSSSITAPRAGEPMKPCP